MRQGVPAAAVLLLLSACGEPDRAAAPASERGSASPTAPVAPPRKAGVMPKVGEMAPDFRVQDHLGRERSLAEFRGKRVVLWFFPKADTPG